jgi:hypothetical protein
VVARATDAATEADTDGTAEEEEEEEEKVAAVVVEEAGLAFSGVGVGVEVGVDVGEGVEVLTGADPDVGLEANATCGRTLMDAVDAVAVAVVAADSVNGGETPTSGGGG